MKKEGENYNAWKRDSDKVLVQKSGYFSRSAPPNKKDLELIFSHADLAVKCALKKINGVIGIDQKDNQIKCIDFTLIEGGKPFDYKQEWFNKLLKDINQI